MPWWILLALLFVTWCAATAAAAGNYAVEDARAGIPEGKRRGVSCMPGIPCFPLVLCSLALLIDLVVEPWGTVVIGSLHVVLLVVSVGSAARDVWRLRRIEQGK